MKKLQSAVTRANSMVKSVLLCSILMPAAAAVCSCADDDPVSAQVNVNVNVPSGTADTLVTIRFTGPSFTVEEMARTRAALTSSVASYLDVWIYEGTTETAAVHQTSSDADFGTVTATLEKTKTYTLYAMAHKGDGAATLSDGVVSFPDDKIRDTFWYSTTFSPADATTVSCALQRIVAQFRLMITDDIPAEVKKMRITVGSVFDRWSVTGEGTHQIDRISTVSYGGTSKNFSVYAITASTETSHTISVDALDESDNVIQNHVFADVPMRNNYKTQYQGAFFTDAGMTLTFTVEDWNDYETVNF